MEEGSVDPQRFADAYELTAAAGPARVRFEYDTVFRKAQWAEIGRSMPRSIRIATWPIRVLVRRETRDVEMGRSVSDAVIDLRRGAVTLEGLGPPQVVVGNRMWYGRPGEELGEDDSALPEPFSHCGCSRP